MGNGEDKGNMDDVVNQLAKELADAIGAAVADNAKIEACRAKAREAGFDLRVSVEAVVGFVNRTSGAAVTRVTTPARLLPGKREYAALEQRPPLPAFAAYQLRRVEERRVASGRKPPPLARRGHVKPTFAWFATACAFFSAAS